MLMADAAGGENVAGEKRIVGDRDRLVGRDVAGVFRGTSTRRRRERASVRAAVGWSSVDRGIRVSTMCPGIAKHGRVPEAFAGRAALRATAEESPTDRAAAIRPAFGSGTPESVAVRASCVQRTWCRS